MFKICQEFRDSVIVHVWFGGGTEVPSRNVSHCDVRHTLPGLN